jgi:hypothetical protein
MLTGMIWPASYGFATLRAIFTGNNRCWISGQPTFRRQLRLRRKRDLVGHRSPLACFADTPS